MTQEFWENLVGRKICGGYLLRRLLGSTDKSAVYRTAYGESNADFKLVLGDELPPEVNGIDHPHLVEVFARGKGEVDGSSVYFVITEAGDENLGSVVASRALTADETKEMLGPVLDALGYLHGRALTHGSLKPSNILAIGNTVKLSVDTIRATGAGASPDEDMRSLGLTLIEVLTQEREPAAVAKVPQPFRDIIEHALQSDAALRWTPRQAALRLSGIVPPPPTVAPAPAVTPVARTAEAAKRPVVVDKPVEKAKAAEQDVAPPRKAMPFWAFPAAAVVMLLAVVLVLARGTGSSPAASAPPVVVTPTPATKAPNPVNTPPAITKDAAPLHRENPPKPTPFDPAPHSAAKPVTKTPPPAAKSSTKATGSGWFVVVASYTREADASKEARLLGGKFPQFKPSVFPPSPIDTHYLVIIGSGLSSDGAESLRQRAVASGLPRDTYIKKYPRS